MGLAPLLLAPISESFGRKKLLIACMFLIVVLFLPQSLAPNITSLSVSRLFQGTAASVEGPVVAGIITDLYSREGGRGTAMSTFTLFVFTANAFGPLCCNWLSFKTHWSNMYWLQMALNGVTLILICFVLEETRHDVILDRKVRKYNKENGTDFQIKSDAAHSVTELITKSLTRPIVYLFTEPIVIALSLWVGFAWGCVFLATGTVTHVFEKTYGFNQGQAGTVLITGFIGALLAWVVNFGQNALFDRSKDPVTGFAPPEARLYHSALGGLLFGLFEIMFAYTAKESTHWIVPCVALTIVNFGIMPIYSAVYAYIGDAYESYSSSAQASQALLRNVLGATFPFFGTAMYDNLNFKYASIVIGSIALALSLVPFILLLYGAKLRDMSKVTKSIMIKQEQDRLARKASNGAIEKAEITHV